MAQTPKKRIRPLAAWRAVRALMETPDDTKLVFDIIEALEGGADDRNFARFAATETGQVVLREQRDIVNTLTDRDALRAMPPGSLGHTYAAFMDRENISADGLVDASTQGARAAEPNPDPDRSRFGARIRDTHDLWHVVTGYNRDLVGEASLLAFTNVLIRNRGISLIVFMAWLHAGGDERAMIRQARKRAKRVAWMPAADWEALLPQPLEVVRDTLGLDAPPVYTEVRSEGAPALA